MPSKTTTHVTDRALTPCPPELAFRFADGSTARDLRELLEAVRSRDLGLVEHHRGHYHYWVRDVLVEPKLADDLLDIGNRMHLSGEALRAALVDAMDARVSAGKRPKKAATAKKAASKKSASSSSRVRR